MRIPVLASLMRVSAALPLAVALLALAAALSLTVRVPVFPLGLGIPLVALAMRAARRRGMRGRAPVSALRLVRHRFTGCRPLPGYRVRMVRGQMTRRSRHGRAEGVMGEALDRGGGHVREGGGRRTAEHQGDGGGAPARPGPRPV